MELPPPSPFAGLPSFEPDRVSPSPSLDGYRPASAGAEEFRWGLDQPAGRAGGASEARGAGAAAGRRGAAAARPCALPPRAPASSALGLQTGAEPAPTPARCPCMLPLCRRGHSSRSSLDGCLLHAAASAAAATAAPGRAVSAGSTSSSSLLQGSSAGGNPFEVAELLGQISLLAPAPARPASADGAGPRAITDGSNRVAWIQPSGELAAALCCLPVAAWGGCSCSSSCRARLARPKLSLLACAVLPRPFPALGPSFHTSHLLLLLLAAAAGPRHTGQGVEDVEQGVVLAEPTPTG